MNMQRILFIYLLLVNVALSARADLVDPGRRRMTCCYRLTNTGQFPNYVFLAQRTTGFGTEYTILRLGQSVCDADRGMTIFAIPQAHFNEEAIKGKDTEGLEHYFDSNPYLIRADIYLNTRTSVSEKDSVKAISDILRIKTLTPDTLVLAHDSIEYRYSDVRVNKYRYPDSGIRPEPASSTEPIPSGKDSPFWLVLGGGSVIALFVALYVRNRDR